MASRTSPRRCDTSTTGTHTVCSPCRWGSTSRRRRDSTSAKRVRCASARTTCRSRMFYCVCRSSTAGSHASTRKGMWSARPNSWVRWRRVRSATTCTRNSTCTAATGCRSTSCTVSTTVKWTGSCCAKGATCGRRWTRRASCAARSSPDCGSTSRRCWGRPARAVRMHRTRHRRPGARRVRGAPAITLSRAYNAFSTRSATFAPVNPKCSATTL